MLHYLGCQCMYCRFDVIHVVVVVVPIDLAVILPFYDWLKYAQTVAI
jgi:hypothetical protein